MFYCWNNNNRIGDSVAEKAKTRYIALCNEARSTLELKFKMFFESNYPIDFFLGKQFYSELWQFIKLGLMFSHGNATVESGFSLNKTLVENMQEHSLFAEFVPW